MNLHKAFPDKGERGVTLLEVMLVVLLLGVLLSVAVPISFRFYHTQVQTETLRTVLNTVRLAQLQAQYDIHASAVGVKLFPSQLVVFQGDSYTLRDISKDAITEIEPALTLTGDDEVVFARLSGLPDTGTTLSFTRNTRTSTVVISPSGLVDTQQ
jgi:prepilin-type N-terminal cleavage/methylation domain-containing protein